MWIFTSKSFVSIVADKDDLNGDRLLVRSRAKGAINELFPDADEFYMTGSDYAYRAWVKRNEVSRVIQNYINSLDYDNFKNSIKDKDYSSACMGVWTEMFNYQGDQLGLNDYDGDNYDGYTKPPSNQYYDNFYGQKYAWGRK